MQWYKQPRPWNEHGRLCSPLCNGDTKTCVLVRGRLQEIVQLQPSAMMHATPEEVSLLDRPILTRSQHHNAPARFQPKPKKTCKAKENIREHITAGKADYFVRQIVNHLLYQVPAKDETTPL